MDPVPIKKKVKSIFIKSGMKDITVLSTSTILAQLIGILVMPIVTRLYPANAFGILAIVNSIVLILGPILTLQYHMSIVTAKTDREADALCALCFYLIIIMGVLSTIGIFVYNFLNPTTFSVSGPWIYSAIPLLIITGIGYVVDSYNNRYGQYKLMASVYLQRSIASNIVKLLLGFFKVGFSGLIVSQFIGAVFGLKKQAEYILENYKNIINTNFTNIKTVAKKYKNQPLYSMPGLFVTSFSYSILPIFISSLYSLEETGYYSLSMTVLGLPLTLISGNVARVFFRNSTKEKERKGNFSSTFKSTALVLSIVSLFGFTFLWFVVEPLFTVLFGDSWYKSGIFTKILIPMIAIRFVVSSLMHGFIISGKQLLKLIIQCLFIIEVFIIYMIAVTQNIPIEVFLKLICITYSINYCILFVILFFISKKS